MTIYATVVGQGTVDIAVGEVYGFEAGYRQTEERYGTVGAKTVILAHGMWCSIATMSGVGK